MYLITAYFDEESNRNLAQIMKGLAETCGNSFLLDHQVPPHLTICQVEARGPEGLTLALENLKGKLESGEIYLVSPGMLLPYVACISPLGTEYLGDLSHRVYDAIKDIREAKVSKYYRPGSWYPHVTMGKTLTRPQLSMAMDYLADHFTPCRVKLTELGLAEVNPHKDLLCFNLL